MGQIGVIGVVLALLGVVLGWGVWVIRQRSWAGAVAWGAADEQAVLERVAALGLTQRSERTLFGRRVLQAWGERDGVSWQLEVCTSVRGGYVRLFGQPASALDQGVRILREAGAGALGWLWRMREVRFGEAAVDERLVLLARDEERLRVLLGTQLREELLLLERLSDRMEVGDEGVFVQLDRVCGLDELEALLSAATATLDRLRALARAWGGVSERSSASYGEVLKAELGREGGEALELADPGSTTGRMQAVDGASAREG
jgi:hypothetical protein